MGLVSQYSRLLHHTITGASGSTFSVPATEDFTDGSWSVYDLCLSEIAVNETDEKAYIRIGSTIKEFEFTGGTSSPGLTPSLSDVLSVGNNAFTYSIVMGGGLIESTGGLTSLLLTDQELVVATPVIIHTNGISSTPIYYENQEIQTTTASTVSIFTFPVSLLSQDAAISFDAIVNGFNTVSGDSYFAKLFAGFRSISSSITQIGITNITELSIFTSSVTSDLITDGADIFLDVTGESGQTINWTLRINYQYTL